MKTLKILSVFLLAVFFLSFASAASVYGTWGNQQEQILSEVITEGESSSFIAETFSVQSASTLNIKVYDSQNTLIHAFEENRQVSKGTLFSKEYTVTPNIYDEPGVYKVLIESKDSVSTVSVLLTLTVNEIIDTTNPVITLLGTNPVTVTQGNTYNDAGATATDNIDGDLTSQIVVVNNVNTNAIGVYTVTYTVQDSAGNVAVATRTVNVVAQVDNQAPTITLLGSSTINLQVGQTYTEYGATASDNVDGDITGNIVITNPVNIYVPGTYIVRYNVVDSSGNQATEVTRTVIVSQVVIDTEAPVITLLGNTLESVALGSTYNDAGATAADNVDGDLTSQIVVVNNVDTNTLGTYEITYNVMDAAGNAAEEVVRIVNVYDANDMTAPTINVITPENDEEYDDEDLIFEIEVNEVSQVTFSLDGNSNITMDFAGSSNGVLTFIYEVNNLNEGDHEVVFYAMDAAGNVASEEVEFSIDTDSSSSKKKNKSSKNYVNDFTSDEQNNEYLNQFKSGNIIYIDSENLDSSYKNWFQRFIDWLIGLFN